jgi:hypothetical protein
MLPHGGFELADLDFFFEDVRDMNVTQKLKIGLQKTQEKQAMLRYGWAQGCKLSNALSSPQRIPENLEESMRQNQYSRGRACERRSGLGRKKSDRSNGRRITAFSR